MSSATARGKLLRISSEGKRAGETNGDVSVILNNASFIQNVRGVVVKSVSLKHVFPNIFSGNQTISYTYDGNPSSFSIASAWYTAAELVAALNVGFAADAVVTGSVVVSLASVTADSKYFKFTSDLALTIHDKDTNLMADVLGVDAEQTGTVITMTRHPDLGGLSTVYLCSGELAASNASASSNFGEQVPVVCEIPVNAGFGEQITYRSYDDELESIIYPSERQLTKIGLALCTRSGALLDLQQNNLTAVFKVLGHEYFASD
jgi:hypothetical protein